MDDELMSWDELEKRLKPYSEFNRKALVARLLIRMGERIERSSESQEALLEMQRYLLKSWAK